MWFLAATLVFAQDPDRPPVGATPPEPPPPPRPAVLPDGTPPTQPPADLSAANPTLPVDTGRPLVYKLEDSERHFTGTPVLIATQPFDKPQVYTLTDDGKSPDQTAGDRTWVAFGRIDPEQPVQLALHSDTEDGPIIFQQSVTLKVSEQPLQIVLHVGANGVTVDASPETSGPPQPQAQHPEDHLLPPSYGISSSELPWPTFGLALLSIGGLAWGVRSWQDRRLVMVPPPGEPWALGMKVDRSVWVVPPQDLPLILESLLASLTIHTPVLLVGPAVEGIGHLWRLRKTQPSPAQLRRAFQNSAAQLLVLAGIDAIEPPLDDEPPAGVVEELFGLFRAPMLVLLREGEALPRGIRVVRWIREGEDLVGPTRLRLRNRRWEVQRPEG